MKVASKLILLFKDSDGLASSISEALQPSPNSSVRRLEESLELSLERYGIEDCRAHVDLVHFVDGNGVYQVSLLIRQARAPPTLACALNEVLEQVTTEEAQVLPTLYVPFVASPSTIKCETKSLPGRSSKTTIYCMPVGPETNIPGAIFSKTEKAPTPLQIQYEPLACLLHFVRILKFPTIFLFGKRGGSSSDRRSTEELEIFSQMGEVLADTAGLSLSKDRISWTPEKRTSNGPEKEPWRALYG